MSKLICRCGSTDLDTGGVTMVWAADRSGPTPVDTVVCMDCGRQGEPEIFTADFHERQRKWREEVDKLAKKEMKKK